MVSEFARHVQTTIHKHSLLDERDSVLVGVSGGADSVALLLSLLELGYSVIVAHLNHGLRGRDSNEDQAFVHALCESLGIAIYSETMTQPSEGNVEAAGREAHDNCFERLRNRLNLDKIAVAHNRNDRVETFLLHLFRGAGLEGLVSMAPRQGQTVRPLIETDRLEIEDYLKSCGQAWRTDQTNSDPAFARNRLRNITIPDLTRNYNSQLSVTLARTVEILQEEDQLLRAEAETWISRNGTVQQEEVELDADALGKTPASLVRRVIRASLKEAGSTLKDVTFEHIEQVRSLLNAGKSGKFVQIPGGLTVARQFDRLVFRLPLEPPIDFTYDLKIPGLVHIPELQRVCRAEIVDREKICSDNSRVFVDGGRLGPYVRIRSWKPGDYYRPKGLPAGKLKKLFQRARIPRSQRSRCPVFVNDSEIIWVASFPVSREFAPCGHSRTIVALEAEPG